VYMDAPEIVEYACNDVVSIRKCREAVFPWGVTQAYWYIKRPLYLFDHQVLGWSYNFIRDAKQSGFNVVYWNGACWALHSPMQFHTVDEAWVEWCDKVRVWKTI